MSYQEQIRQARPEMSKSFAKLADFLLDSYIEASFMTATELAHQLNLDAATVVRFSQSLGYAGYPELQREIREHVKVDLMVRPVEAREPDSIPGVVSSAMQELRETLERTQMSLDTDAISQLVEHIGKARRIVVLAEGPAQPAAYNLVYFLEQANFPVHIARPGLAGLARTIHTATAQDLLIALDVANEAPYIAPALREARGKDIATAAIVGSPSLASSRSADIVLAARATANIGVEIVSIEAIIFALVQALRWNYADRYAGAEQAIQELSALFQ
ncbi:MAG: MurR/RpiR family transcriptional regulator [Candidatus Promineifilaceae bacterium]